MEGDRKRNSLLGTEGDRDKRRISLDGDRNTGNRIQVFARARPLVDAEVACVPCVEVQEGARLVRVRTESNDNFSQGGSSSSTVLEAEGSPTKSSSTVPVGPNGELARAFSFNAVFGASSTQQDVFAQVGQPVLEGCLQGLNGTILAYGQTGSGKTHSLLHQGPSSDDAGLLPRLVASLFSQIARDDESVCEVEAAALQVYNEQVDDLLSVDRESGSGLNLAVQNNGQVPGLTWVRCRTPATLLETFGRARSNLVYAETRMNKASSRSHAIFQVKLTKRKRLSKDTQSGGESTQMECVCARLNVVDLAGSERVKKSGVEGAQLKEALAINKSLLVFGNVVSALAAKRAHVPFRESKLTRILDGSIGGNSRTALLVCVSPATENAAETLSALEFASRAMRVEVDARVNRSLVDISKDDLLEDAHTQLANFINAELQDEIMSLKRTVAEERARADEAESCQKAAALRAAELEEELKKLRQGHLESVSQLEDQHSKTLEELKASEARAAESAEDMRIKAEAHAEELASVRQERDQAVADAKDAEEKFESELENLMAEVEESAERDLQRQREMDELMATEQQRAAEELKVVSAELEEWKSRHAEVSTELEELAEELMLYKERSPREEGVDARDCRQRSGMLKSGRHSTATCRASSADDVLRKLPRRQFLGGS